MDLEDFPDVLALRYASSGAKAIWGRRRKAELLRDLWILILEIQQKYGLAIPEGAVEAYKRTRDNIDLVRIDALDLELRHDVMAQLRAFNEVAGYECLHQGLTSRDETDNVEQCQIFAGLGLARDKTVAILVRLRNLALEYQALAIAGRSHLAPGQPTTHGKRLATHARELMLAFEHLEQFIERYPLRGIKGAMGTQQDMLDIFGGSEMSVTDLDSYVRDYFGFPRVLDSTGQVYPRTLDLEVLDILVQLAAACSNFAKTVRLMAGLGLAQEGRKKGQKGSSAMPHKKNARTSERIVGLYSALCGFKTMIERIAGDQWFEGDVSCSVPRRLAFPGAFFALDGLYEAMLTVLDEMEVFPALIKRELKYFQPFLSTTAFLMAAVETGMGRESAYDIIQKHAMDTAAEIEAGGENTLVTRLVNDGSFKVAPEEIYRIASEVKYGRAERHVESVCKDIDVLAKRYPDMASYNPEPLR